MRQIQAGICFLILLVSTYNIADYVAPIKFEHLSMQHGISHNLIYCMMQDQKGFLWIGTMYGLVRYDGLRYTVFRHDPADSTSLSHDDIVALYEDDQEEIWIGTWGGGLNRLDKQRQTFTRYLPNSDQPELSIGAKTAWNILETQSGNQRSIWLATQGAGISRMIFESDELIAVQHYRSNPDAQSGLDYNFIRSLILDDAGDIWIGAVGGLYQLRRHNNYSGPIERYPLWTTELDKRRPPTVITLVRNEHGDFWAGTGAHGLGHLSLENRQARQPGIFYLHDRENPGGIISNNIQSLLFDSEKQLWIGTDNGLSILQEGSDGKAIFQNLQHDADNPWSLSSNSVIALCEDVSGTVFAATYYGGLDKYTRGKNKFQRFGYRSTNPAAALPARDVSAVAIGRDNEVWLATRNGGITEIREAGTNAQEVQHLRHDADAKGGIPANISAILPTADTPWFKGDQLLIGSIDAGLATLRLSDRAFQKIELPKPPRVQAPIIPITNLLRDGNVLWIGAQYGFYRYDMAADSLNRFMPNRDNPHTLPHYWITNLYKDSKGRLWIGSYGGLSYYDEDKKQFVNYIHDIEDPNTISNNYVYAMAEDKLGRFWIGTSGGLNLMNPDDQSFQSFHLSDGLPNEVICGIVVDDDNHLWLSSHRGLFRTTVHDSAGRASLEIQPYDVADGLQSNVFNPGVFAQSSNGQAYFGGIDGLNRFHPSSIEQRLFTPAISVNMVFPNQTLQIENGEQLEFDQEPQTVAFDFASLDYSAPEKNQFAYRLSNHHPEWIQNGNQSRATFTNLPAGSYRLEVKGSNSDLHWNDQVATVDFVIHPPFWRTSGFYLLASLLLIGLILLLHYYQVRLKIRQSLLIERARSKERDKIREKTAQDYHDELGHQLTKISLYSELVKRDIASWQHEGLLVSPIPGNGQEVGPNRPEHIFNYLEKITSASQSLCLSARDFIWTLNPDNDSLFDVGNHLQLFGEDLFEEMDIDFKVDGLSPNFHTTRLSMDQRRHVVLLFKEAMNNVARHSHAKSVCLSIDKTAEGDVLLRLRDNGRGIHQHRRDGSGLANMRKRAAKIGAEFRIDSMPGFGTAIVLQFPTHAETPYQERNHV